MTRTTLSRRSALVVAVLVTVLVGLQATSPTPAAASGFAVGVGVVSTGTGSEDHGSAGVLDPGDELDHSDEWVRTLDLVTAEVSYVADDGAPGGSPSTNLVVTATINSPHAGWDLRGLDFVNGQAPPCPGGAVVGPRNVLTCSVPTPTALAPVSFSPALRVSAAAGHNHAFDITVTATDDQGRSQTATSSTIRTSAAPRWDLQKIFLNQVQDSGAFRNPGMYYLRIADADPLGVSALAGSSLTFTDAVDQASRITSCYDTGPFTVPGPVTNPISTLREVGFTCTPLGGPNGSTVSVTFTGIDWERIYPPPTGLPNGFGGVSNAVAVIGYDMTTDFTDVDLSDTVLDGQGTLRVGNAIGMSGYDSSADIGIGPSTFNPIDVDGSPNLGSDDLPGEDDLGNNDVAVTLNLVQDMRVYKYAGQPVVDGERFVVDLRAWDSGTTAWPTVVDLCDKFDNRRMSIVRAPNSSEAVVNVTAPQAPPFANAIIEYGQSSAWGPGAGPSGSQWHAMAGSGCSNADGQWFTSSQIDWTNNGGGSLDAADVNMVRYRPAGVYTGGSQGPGGFGTYYLAVHFEANDNDAGDYLVDYASLDADGAGTNWDWLTTDCNSVSQGICPDPPHLRSIQGKERPGPTPFSDALIHVDTHPTIAKEVIGPDSGSTPVDFRYRLSLGNTQVPGDTGSRAPFTVRDVLPPGLAYQAGSAQVVSNAANLVVTGPIIATQGQSEVLEWEVSGLTLDVDPADMPVIEYVAEAGIFTPTGSYTNRATIQGDGILASGSTPWNAANDLAAPEDYRDLTAGVNTDGTTRSRWGFFSEARVDVNGIGRVITTKAVDRPVSRPGETFTYSLSYGNGGNDIERMDGYDLLPFDGDGRGTATAGSLELLDVREDPGSPVEVWVSDLDPAVLDALDTTQPSGTGAPVVGGINPTWPNLPATGSPTWPCTLDQVQQSQSGCPTLDAVTALRFVGNDPNPGASGGQDSFLPSGAGPFVVEVDVRSVGGRGGDAFHNSFSARFAPVATPITATSSVHELTESGLGDLVYEDVDANGAFGPGDLPLPSVRVEVLDGQGNFVAADVTDSGGRWLIEGLDPGDYQVRLPAWQFDPGQVLDDFLAAPGAAADPDVDVNEDVDHDAHQVGNAVEAGDEVTLTVGGEPTGDDVAQLSTLRDVDSNLTVDLGLVRAEAAVGDLVFEDVDADGRFGAGDLPVEGVDIEVRDGQGNLVGSAQTDAAGRWMVRGLEAGDYEVSVPAGEFGPGGTLEGYVATPNAAADPNGDIDETEDHDAHMGSGGLIAGGAVHLEIGSEPTGDDVAGLTAQTLLRDVDVNLTVDFGVVRAELAVGDRVFEDVDLSGTWGIGDRPMGGVRVEVLDDQGSLIGHSTTDADGRWIVAGLDEGEYQVVIPASELAPGGPLEGFVAAPGGAVDPDVDRDEAADHDAASGMGGIEAGDLVTLTIAGEPTGDDPGSLFPGRDEDANLTVDLAVVKAPADATPHEPSGSPPSGGGPSGWPIVGSLARTGWAMTTWTAIGFTMLVLGAVVLRARRTGRVAGIGRFTGGPR